MTEIQLIDNQFLALPGFPSDAKLRITTDKKICVFDFIRVIGGQKNPRDTWKSLKQKYNEEIIGFSDDHQFEKGKKKIPVINAQGVVKILMWIPGETAKQFRSKSAEILVRYLGGDTTLINEIKQIDQFHTDIPDNPASIFRNQVLHRNKWIPSDDEINEHNRILDIKGNDTSIMYSAKVTVEGDNNVYSKSGIVLLRNLLTRTSEHVKEFVHFYLYQAVKCVDVHTVEKRYKNLAIVANNQRTIQSNTQTQTEITLLSPTITTRMLGNAVLEAGKELILDKPPGYEQIASPGLEIEQEKTKQKLIELEIRKVDLKICLAELDKQRHETHNDLDEMNENTVIEFITVCLKPEKGNKIIVSQVWTMYDMWCEENKEEKCSKDEFEQTIVFHFKITGKKREYIDNKRVYAWTGINTL